MMDSIIAITAIAKTNTNTFLDKAKTARKRAPVKINSVNNKLKPTRLFNQLTTKVPIKALIAAIAETIPIFPEERPICVRNIMRLSLSKFAEAILTSAASINGYKTE